MAYQSTKPAASDRLSVSQGDIQGNFADLKTLIDVNHGTFGASDEGKHKYVSMPEQASAPTVAANELALYSRESTLTSVAEMAYRRESSGSVIEFTSSASSADGWTRDASGILWKWGSSTANGAATITFPTGATIPAFTTCRHVFLQVVDTGAAPDTFVTLQTIPNALTFTVYGGARSTVAAASTNFRYLAVGV